MKTKTKCVDVVFVLRSTGGGDWWDLIDNNPRKEN